LVLKVPGLHMPLNPYYDFVAGMMRVIVGIIGALCIPIVKINYLS
jgi:hypothetical protein